MSTDRRSTRERIVPKSVGIGVLIGVMTGVMLAASCGVGESSRSSGPPSTESVIVAELPPTSVPASVAPRPLEGRVVAIDPGHNGGNAAHAAEINRLVDAGNGITKACDTTGTSTDDGYPEYEFSMAVAADLRVALEEIGATVVMVRTDSSGWGPCITGRAAIGNDAAADVAISIHGDGNASPDARGYHVLVPARSASTAAIVEPSGRFGTLLRDEFGSTGMPVANYLGSNGLMVRGDLGGLNLSTVPKVFIECGNMRHPTDAAMMRSREFQLAAADAMATAILKFLA